MADCSCNNFPASLGNVTFGTQNAGVAAVFAGTGITQVLLDSSGANWGRIQNDAANTWSLGYGTANSTALGTPVLAWNSSGQVGIGTTAPSDTLEVDGNIRIGGSTGYFINMGTGIAQILLDSSGANWGKIQNDTANTWSLGYDTSRSSGLGTPLLSWTSSGYVGIGKTNPAQALDVNGTVSCGGGLLCGGDIRLNGTLYPASGNNKLVDGSGCYYG